MLEQVVLDRDACWLETLVFYELINLLFTCARKVLDEMYYVLKPTYIDMCTQCVR